MAKITSANANIIEILILAALCSFMLGAKFSSTAIENIQEDYKEEEIQSNHAEKTEEMQTAHIVAQKTQSTDRVEEEIKPIQLKKEEKKKKNLLKQL